MNSQKKENFYEAIDSIIVSAKNEQVFMINENHKIPEHRIFSEMLLAPLYNIGYKYLAVETLNERDKQINLRKFPIKSSGTYISEPSYSNFVRKALELGYILVPYEITIKEEEKFTDDGSQSFIKYREECQAKHLSRIIKMDSAAKIFVHAGGDHIVKKSKTKWMAERFKEKTGITPYTVTQAHFLDNHMNKSRVLLKKPDSIHKEKFDLILTYPPTKKTREEMYKFLERDKVKILVDFNATNKVEVFIYILNEYEEYKDMSIPVYYKKIEGKETKIFLPKKKKYLLLLYENSFLINKKKFLVNNPLEVISINLER